MKNQIKQTKNRTDLAMNKKKIIEITDKSFSTEFIKNEINILAKR